MIVGATAHGGGLIAGHLFVEEVVCGGSDEERESSEIRSSRLLIWLAKDTMSCFCSSMICCNKVIMRPCASVTESAREVRGVIRSMITRSERSIRRESMRIVYIGVVDGSRQESATNTVSPTSTTCQESATTLGSPSLPGISPYRSCTGLASRFVLSDSLRYARPFRFLGARQAVASLGVTFASLKSPVSRQPSNSCGDYCRRGKSAGKSAGCAEQCAA